MRFREVPTSHGVIKAIDLPSTFGQDFARLPFVHRILLENVARKDTIRLPHMIAALRRWLVSGASEAEVAFHPSRVLMHDTTCVPALVDIAAMRDTITEAGGDPASLTPVLPVDVSAIIVSASTCMDGLSPAPLTCSARWSATASATA